SFRLFVIALDHVHEPAPGFALAWSRGLFDADGEIGDFALHLLAGQQRETAGQNRRLDHRRLRAVESTEWSRVDRMHRPAEQPGALRILSKLGQLHLFMRERRFEDYSVNALGRTHRPVAFLAA